MKHQRSRACLVAAGLATVGLAMPAAALSLSAGSGAFMPRAISAAAQPTIALPLHVTTHSVGALPVHIVPGNPTRAYVRLHANGNGTPIGPFETFGHQTNIADENARPISVIDGFTALLAPNGDSIYLAFSGLLRTAFQPGAIIQDMPCTITGGAGRFQGATGTGRIIVLLNLQTFEAIGDIDGTIILPATTPPPTEPSGQVALSVTGQATSLRIPEEPPVDNVQVRLTGRSQAPSAGSVRFTGAHILKRDENGQAIAVDEGYGSIKFGNGPDELYIIYNAVQISADQTGPPIQGLFFITGGRGRFAGANGLGGITFTTRGSRMTITLGGQIVPNAGLSNQVQQ